MPGGLPRGRLSRDQHVRDVSLGRLRGHAADRAAPEQWNAVKQHISGGFPYSEGIFEDMTKAVLSQLYWNDRPAAETVREYVAFEYSPEVVDEMVKVIGTLEQNHHMALVARRVGGRETGSELVPLARREAAGRPRRGRGLRHRRAR